MDGLLRFHNFCPRQDNLQLGTADKICLGLNSAMKFTKLTTFGDGLVNTAKFATGQNQLNKQKCTFVNYLSFTVQFLVRIRMCQR